jgi:hypothetical protein
MAHFFYFKGLAYTKPLKTKKPSHGKAFNWFVLN